MHRLVATVFKAIMFAMIFVFVWDIGFYLFRAFSLNQRMESIMTSMQKVVMENNYLPEGDYQMYVAIFEQLAEDMNGDGSPDDIFINGFNTNYTRQPVDTLNDLRATKYTLDGGVRPNQNILKKTMSVPASYGDVMVVQTSVNINMPVWNWGGAAPDDDYTYSGEDSREWHRVGYLTTTFTYTYYVPCLKYQSIQEI